MHSQFCLKRCDENLTHPREELGSFQSYADTIDQHVSQRISVDMLDPRGAPGFNSPKIVS